MLLTLVPHAISKIIDYSDTYFMAVTDGQVATYKYHDYLIHQTNLTEYELAMRESEGIIDQLSDARATGMIREQIREIQRLLDMLRVNRRSARSLDFLGSALKFIAGTPDHNDMELLTTREDLLIQNNDRQAVVNSAMQDRINELTERVNTMQNYGGSNAIKEDDLVMFELLAMRNGEIISFLDNLALSIILAKENIIHPAILDNVYLEKKFESRVVPISINDRLRVSNVSVIQNNSLIYYVIKYPIFTNFCEYLKVFPVIHNNSIIRLEINQASKCPDYTLPITSCTNIGTSKICRETTDNCLSQLLNNNSASCSTQSAENVPPIQWVTNGLILLNNVYETNIFEEDTIKVNGTLVVVFTNNVTINGTLYQKTPEPMRNLIPHPPKTLNLKKTGHEQLITLPYIHKLNLENTGYIERLKNDTFAHKIALASLIILVPFVTWVTYHLQMRCRRQTMVNVEDIIKEIKSKQGRLDI